MGEGACPDKRHPHSSSSQVMASRDYDIPRSRPPPIPPKAMPPTPVGKGETPPTLPAKPPPFLAPKAPRAVSSEEDWEEAAASLGGALRTLRVGALGSRRLFVC